MIRQLTINQERIDDALLTSGRRLSGGMGAVVSFTGVVRDQEDGTPIGAIEDQAFQRMADQSACCSTKWRSAGRWNRCGWCIAWAW